MSPTRSHSTLRSPPPCPVPHDALRMPTGSSRASGRGWCGPRPLEQDRSIHSASSRAGTSGARRRGGLISLGMLAHCDSIRPRVLKEDLQGDLMPHLRLVPSFFVRKPTAGQSSGCGSVPRLREPALEIACAKASPLCVEDKSSNGSRLPDGIGALARCECPAAVRIRGLH